VKRLIPFLCIIVLLALTSSEPAKVYAFQSKLVYSLKSGVADPQLFTFYFNDEFTVFGFVPDKSTGEIDFMIVDESLMTHVFIESGGLAFRFSLDLPAIFQKYGEEIPIGLVAVEATPPSMEEFDGKFIKTGRRKIICGFEAKQYRITGKDGFIDLWIADASFDTRIFKTLFNLADLPKLALNFANEKNPLLLEARVQSVNQEPLHFTAIHYGQEKKSFRTTKYEAIDMTDMQNIYIEQRTIPDSVR
jgi:hypothetical protein